MMNTIKVVMVEPEIPGNTGNIMRLCASTGSELHLIGPLGFFLDNRLMHRAGLDYKEFCVFRKHVNWDEFWKTESPNLANCFAFTTKTEKSLFQINESEDEAWLFFGAESKGLSQAQKEIFKKKNLLRIPMIKKSRSLNLSNSVAIGIYQFLRISKFNNGEYNLS